MDPLQQLRDENRQLKAQLVSILWFSDQVEQTEGWMHRKQVIEEMQTAIQSAKPILKDYAVELSVGDD